MLQPSSHDKDELKQHGHLSETKVDKDRPDEMDLPNDLSSISHHTQSVRDGTRQSSFRLLDSDIAKL